MIASLSAAMQAPDEMSVGVARAMRNYAAVDRGASRFEDLTPAEQRDVAAIAARLRDTRPNRLRPDCAPDQEERSRSDLDQAVWRLRCGR